MTQWGTISENTTWSNTVYVSGDITVAPNKTLTISPGTIINVALDDNESVGLDTTRVEFLVNGHLDARGTESNPIIFQSWNGTGQKDWLGITVSDASGGTRFEHVVIKNAETGITFFEWPWGQDLISNLQIQDCDMGVRNADLVATFDGISTTGCRIGFSTLGRYVTFTDITATDCGMGFVHSVDTVVINGATFTDCDTAIMTWDDLTLRDSEIRNNTVSGFTGLLAKGGDLRLAKSTITNKAGSRTGCAVKIDSTVATAVIDTCNISKVVTAIATHTQTTLTGCSIDDCVTGVNAPFYLPVTLIDCTVVFDHTGVFVSGPLQIHSSRVTKSGVGPGATAVEATNAEIRDSYIGATVTAVSLDSGFLRGDTLSSEGWGLIIDGPVTCRETHILGSYSNCRGIDASDATDSLALREVTVSGFDVGVYVGAGGSGDIDSSCTITGNDTGIEVFNTTDVTIRGSTIDGNTTNGISLNAAVALVEGNTITNSSNGIFLYNSPATIRAENVIEDNSSGIKCDLDSDPLIRENKIASNGVGITALNEANPDVGWGCGVVCDTACTTEGRNNISANTNYHISNLSPSVTVMAECNYWGKRGPLPGKFSGAVDYNPYLGSNPVPGLVAEQGGEPAVEDPAEGTQEDPIKAIPTAFDVSQNYPNPFNPVTTIRYQVPEPGGTVQLRIYDVSGVVVRTLVSGPKPPGYYSITWDGRNDMGGPVASGVYFMRMTAPDFVKTQKLIVLK